MDNQQPIDQSLDESILKPKERKRPNFSPEHRAALAERMRKVNETRIANSKSAANAKLAEEKKLAREAKKKELEAEIERLKEEAVAAGPRLAPVPKIKKPRAPKMEEPEDDGYDQLLQKAREVRKPPRAPTPPPPPEYSETESEYEPVPRRKRPSSKKPAASPAPTPAPVVPTVPRIMCKFV